MTKTQFFQKTLKGILQVQAEHQTGPAYESELSHNTGIDKEQEFDEFLAYCEADGYPLDFCFQGLLGNNNYYVTFEGAL